MQKLYKCYNCNKRIACNITGTIRKCYHCGEMDCPFDATSNYDTSGMMCDHCAGTESVRNYTWGDWIKGGLNEQTA